MAQVGSEECKESCSDKCDDESDDECHDECRDCDRCCDIDLRCFKPKLCPKCKECKPPKFGCGCNGEDTGLFGELGTNTATTENVNLHSNQELSVEITPDTRNVQKEESRSCSNEEKTHESCSKGCKFRHFCIKGDIVVSEKVTFKEN